MTFRRIYPALLIGGGLVFSLAVYSRLPDQVPIHWDWQWEPNGWGGRVQGAFLLPGIALMVWLVMRTLPHVDPRRENYEKFADTYDVVVNGLLTFLVTLHVLVLGSALGWPIPLPRVLPALVGVLLLVVGNVLPRARSNFWFGIRTPWTLSSERVWARTHRVGGYLLMLAGCFMLATAAVPAPWTSMAAVMAIVGAVVISVLYSYVAWRKERSQ